MFTGIISGVGIVLNNEKISENERELTVCTPYSDAVLGESISVNGVCLTVAKKTVVENAEDLRLSFYLSRETCERSNLRFLGPNEKVNLERALLATDRLSGHIVQGHVDGQAEVAAIENRGNAHQLWVKIPAELSRYVVEKGSVALDGISLTVNDVKDSEISLMIVPHTWEHTNLTTTCVGQNLNLEVDVIAKYVERMTNAYNR